MNPAEIFEKAHEIMTAQTKIHELRQHVERLQKSLENTPIEMAIALVPASIRPECIMVSAEVNRVVLVRSNLAKEFAFLVFSEHKASTRWQLTLRDCPISRSFSVCCTCCSVNTGVQLPNGSDEEIASWRETREREFQNNLSLVCREHGMHTVFMRNASAWQESTTGIKLVEANHFRKEVATFHGTTKADEAMRFVAGIGIQ